MEEIYPKIIESMRKNHVVVLSTIIKLVGSGPRAAGTKVLVLEDGSFAGTIGGGLLEAKVLEGAKTVFARALPQRIHFTLSGKDVADTDMLCSSTGMSPQVFRKMHRASRCSKGSWKSRSAAVPAFL